MVATFLVLDIGTGDAHDPGQLSLAIPAWVGTMSTGQMGDALRLVVNAHVWWQVKLCEPLYNTCHI